MAEIIATAGMTKEIAKALKESMFALRDYGRESAGTVKETVETLNNFTGLFSPFIIPMQIITATIGSTAFAGGMDLMNGLIKLMIDPDTQYLLQKLGAAIGSVGTEAGSVSSRIADIDFKGMYIKIGVIIQSAIAMMIQPFEDIKDKLAEILAMMIQPFEDIKDKLAEILADVVDVVTAPFESIEKSLTRIATILKDNWEWIKTLLGF